MTKKTDPGYDPTDEELRSTFIQFHPEILGTSTPLPRIVPDEG